MQVQLTSIKRYRMPGGPGGSLPRGSHRSVRAQLRHTAPQVTVSLREDRPNGQFVVLGAETLAGLQPCGPKGRDDWNVVPTTAARCAGLGHTASAGPGNCRSLHSRSSALATSDSRPWIAPSPAGVGSPGTTSRCGAERADDGTSSSSVAPPICPSWTDPSRA